MIKKRSFLFLSVLALVSGAQPLLGAPQGSSYVPPGIQPGGNADSVKALGVSLSDRFQQIINIKDAPYKAKGDSTTDDSAALAAAVSVVNSRLAVSTVPSCIYVPPGQYRIKTPPATFAGNGCVFGNGTQQSTFVLDATFSGDLFSWSESWLGGYPFNGNTPALPLKAGPTVRDLSVVGNRGASGQQNVMMFYDRNDFVTIDNVDASFIPGRVLASGFSKNQPQAYMRESRITRLRAFNSGAANIPVVEFNSAGPSGADASNEDRVVNLDIYGPYGPGLVVRSNGQAVRYLTFDGVRIEGKENNPAGVAADLVTIGDPAQTGTVSKILMRGFELIDPYANYAALRITGTAANGPYGIDFHGFIDGGAMAAGAKGLQIDSGRNSSFAFTQMYTTGTNVTIGPASGGTGPGLYVNGYGLEKSWTYNLDATEAYRVKFGGPSRFGGASGPVSMDAPDGTATGGNQRGTYAFDGQGVGCRSNALQVAAGYASFVFGCYNSVSGITAGAVGNANVAQGTSSFVIGDFGYDFARRGFFVQGAGNSSTYAQRGTTVLWRKTSSTAAARLTQDGTGTPATSNGNCINLPRANSAMTVRMQLVLFDKTTPANSYSWSALANVTEGASASTTALTLGAPQTVTAGATSGTSVSVTADTTNACINFQVTPPNADNSLWVLTAETTEATF